MRNPPSEALVASRFRPVAWEVAVSFAPATTAPEGSTTFPVREPVRSAAYSTEVKANARINFITQTPFEPAYHRCCNFLRITGLEYAAIASANPKDLAAWIG